MCCQVLNSIYLDDYQVVAQLIERLMRLKRSIVQPNKEKNKQHVRKSQDQTKN